MSFSFSSDGAHAMADGARFTPGGSGVTRPPLFDPEPRRVLLPSLRTAPPTDAVVTATAGEQLTMGLPERVFALYGMTTVLGLPDNVRPETVRPERVLVAPETVRPERVRLWAA